MWARALPRGEGWTSLWINLTWKVNRVRGKSLWEMGLLPLKRWKELGQQLHQHLSTPSTSVSAVEARWAFQSCHFTRQWREDKALWPPPNTLIPSGNSYFSDAQIQCGEVARYVWNLVWIVETHWNYPREQVSSVPHVQPAHISYLTVGQSIVKIPLTMWISALICT